MKKYFSLVLVCSFFLMAISGCSSMKRMAVGTTSHILIDAAGEIETENNFPNFEKGVLPTLKLVEALLYVDPENKKFLSTLIKGYAAYGYIINETYYLEDQLAEKEISMHKDAALMNYSRAMEYSFQFLKLHNITYKDMVTAIKDQDGLYKLLDDELSNDAPTRDAMLFMAVALGSLANLQRANMMIAAQLPLAKEVLRWSCSKDPNNYYGMCDLFAAAFDSALPKMLGGNPERGQQTFLKLIKDRPNNWLARLAYIQYYLIPAVDEDGYKEQALEMGKLQAIHEKDLYWVPNQVRDPAFNEKRLRVFQTLAVERFKIIKKFEDDIF